MLPDHFLRPGRPLVLAHRGASRDAPENTLAAFQLAREQGADGVELDVQLCATGEVVVFHDTTLGRITGRPGLLEEASLDTLRTLDAGAHKAARFAGERIPLLQEVLEATPKGFLVNIELKCERLDDRGLTARTIERIRDASASDRVLLSSFNPLCLRHAQSLAPDLPRALLFHSNQGLLLRNAAAAPLVGAHALHPEGVLATPERVARWTRRGYTVSCWTVDAPDEARRLVDAGVRGLITNEPLKLLKELTA
ncbi:MAG: glycerophosphodiester phosphodiesterase [Deltaproteobacteria bacterium]|nr:glycerophosphodiester phosphodiesterase [Deltaproteobacteria bacterium]